MKRLGFILLALVAIAVGLLVGTLNSSPVLLNLLWAQFELPLGLVILLGFSLGILLGWSVAYLSRIVPLQLQLRKARAALARQDKIDQSLPDD